MTILKPLKEHRYQTTITFKDEAKRTPIDALIPRREYKRLVREYTRGEPIGTYEFVIDGNVVEMTFPIQEIDKIVYVSEINEDG